MNYGPRDTSNVDQTLTPRVRTIFRTRPVAPPAPAAHPVTAVPLEKGKDDQQLGWHDLICEILESLFPFPDAYTVVRQTLDAFGAKLPAPS